MPLHAKALTLILASSGMRLVKALSFEVSDLNARAQNRGLLIVFLAVLRLEILQYLFSG